MPTARSEIAVIQRAIEIFVRGFSFTRSFTHPYVAQRVDGLWVTRDADRRNGDYRREEWMAFGTPAAQVDRIAREHGRGHFAACAIHPVNQPDDELRAGYKAIGYRLQFTEPMMVHDLRRIPRCAGPAEIRRVSTQELADRLAKSARSRQVLPEHLASDNPPLRQYVALIDDEIVGWVRSIVVCGGDSTWCSNMYVIPKYRRRGIGRSLLARVLRDDRSHGATLAALTASHTGAHLYEAVGYRQVATLYLFVPRERLRR